MAFRIHDLEAGRMEQVLREELQREGKVNDGRIEETGLEEEKEVGRRRLSKQGSRCSGWGQE